MPLVDIVGTFNPLDLVEKYTLGFISYLTFFFNPSIEKRDTLTLEKDGRIATYSLLGAFGSGFFYTTLTELKIPSIEKWGVISTILISAWIIQIFIMHFFLKSANGASITKSVSLGLRVFPIAAFFSSIFGVAGFYFMDFFNDKGAQQPNIIGRLFFTIAYTALILIYLPKTLKLLQTVGKFRRLSATITIATATLTLGGFIALSQSGRL